MQLRIDGLNTEQVEMLDKLWSMDTMEEVQAFRATLPVFRQQQIDTLITLVYYEMQEEEISNMTEYPEVELLINQIKNR